MKPFNLSEFASIISDGFLADRILTGKPSLAKIFTLSITRGRIMVKTGKILSPNPLDHLRRYNWFMQWILETYGQTKCGSTKEADELIMGKIKDISSVTNEGKLFWKWLQRKTLSECSELLNI